MASPGNRHCANCIGALLFPIYKQSIHATTPVQQIRHRQQSIYCWNERDSVLIVPRGPPTSSQPSDRSTQHWSKTPLKNSTLTPTSDQRILITGRIAWVTQQNCPFPGGYLGTHPNTQYMVPWSHPSPHPKRHLDRFIHCGSALGCVHQIDRHRHYATSVARGRTFALCACDAA